jgi:hypothetical protein
LTEALQGFKHVPAPFRQNPLLPASLLGHLQEQEVSEFAYLLVVRDAVVFQNVAEVPELGNDVVGGGGHHDSGVGRHFATLTGMLGLSGFTSTLCSCGRSTRSMSSIGIAPSSTSLPSTIAPVKQRRLRKRTSTGPT